MKKYIKKPVEIEAVKWNGENHREMFNFLGGEDADYITASGVSFYIDWTKVEGGLVIQTLEGEHIASIGDFIIKGIKGEFYPCKPDIFELTYEEAKGTTFKERLLLEEKELGEKIDKLNIAINLNGSSSKFSYFQFELLGLQHSTMLAYRRVLNIRINNLKED